MVSNIRRQKLAALLAHIGIALLLAGCAANQLKATASRERNASYAAPQTLSEIAIRYIGRRPDIRVTTYGPMSEYKKTAGIEFVERIMST